MHYKSNVLLCALLAGEVVAPDPPSYHPKRRLDIPIPPPHPTLPTPPNTCYQLWHAAQNNVLFFWSYHSFLGHKTLRVIILVHLALISCLLCPPWSNGSSGLSSSHGCRKNNCRFPFASLLAFLDWNLSHDALNFNRVSSPFFVTQVSLVVILNVCMHVLLKSWTCPFHEISKSAFCLSNMWKFLKWNLNIV